MLIYDNRNASGNMTTTVADSGYIRLSDDKRFLEITLFNGERYEQTRNSSQWYNKSSLQRNKFELQKANISISGFEMQRTDADLFNNAQTKKHLRAAIRNRHADTAGQFGDDPIL